MFGSSRDIPEVAPVEVVTVVKKAPTYHPPLPNEIDPVPVEWTVLNPELMQDYLDDLNEGNAPTNVWYALTTKGYENLSTNMAEVKRFEFARNRISIYLREKFNKRTSYSKRRKNLS